MMPGNKKSAIFAVGKKGEKSFSLCLPVYYKFPGQTGFDSGQKWYVSMQCVGDWHFNLSYQNFIWQQQLCSCCLIES